MSNCCPLPNDLRHDYSGYYFQNKTGVKIENLFLHCLGTSYSEFVEEEKLSVMSGDDLPMVNLLFAAG
jgi:hypothetical protein